MHNLLKILQTIVQSYSHLPMKQLFQNFLSLNIFVIANIQIAKQLFKKQFKQIDKAKQEIFFKSDQLNIGSIQPFRGKNQFTQGRQTFVTKKQIYIYIALKHKKMLPLHKYLLGINIKDKINQTNQQIFSHFRFVQNLICVTLEGEVMDNLLQLDKPLLKGQIKGFFMRIPFEYFQQISMQVSLFISICQLFHSHINLALSIHQVQDFPHLKSLINLSNKEFEQDQDEMLTNASYCRIFQALPFKITYDQICSLGQIEKKYWGQTIRIDQGTDGIIFWFLLNHHPILFNEEHSSNQHNDQIILKVSNAQKSIAQNAGLKLTQQKYGHLIFKSKGLIKQPLQQFAMTIFIINIKKAQYCLSLQNIFSPILDVQIKKHKHQKHMAKDYRICEKVCNEVDRLAELLVEIPVNQKLFIKKQMYQTHKKQQAKQLAYDINRWLFIDRQKVSR